MTRAEWNAAVYAMVDDMRQGQAERGFERLRNVLEAVGAEPAAIDNDANVLRFSAVLAKALSVGGDCVLVTHELRFADILAAVLRVGYKLGYVEAQDDVAFAEAIAHPHRLVDDERED